MERKEYPLAYLENKAQQLERAFASVQQTSQSLGSEGGVKRLNRFEPNLSPLERISRIRTIGEIRFVITDRTLPTLENHLQDVTDTIQRHPQTRVQAEILAIRQLFDQGLLTEEEVKQAEEETGRILGTIEFKPTPEEQQERVAELKRIQALQDAINSFDNLTILQRKSLEVGVIYFQARPGSNKDWAKLMNYGENVPEDEAVNRLLISRRKALEKTKGRIEMGNERQGREMAHYLILKEAILTAAAPTPPEQRPAVGKEQARERKMAALKFLMDNREADVEEAIRMVGLLKNRALFALTGQAGELFVKAVKIGRVTWEERQLWDKIKEFSGVADDNQVPKAFAQKLHARFYPERKAAEPETAVLPGYTLDETGRTLTMRGQTYKLTARFVEFLKPLMAGRPVAISELDQILNGLNIKSPAAIVKADIEKSFKQKFIETVGDRKTGYSYVIPQAAISAEAAPAAPEAEKPSGQKPETSENRRKKGQESRLVFEKALPDGQIITIQGKLRADVFDQIVTTSKDNPMTLEQLSMAVYGFYNSDRKSLNNHIHSLRKLLEKRGYTIIQPVAPQQRARGELGRYYLQKMEKEEEVSQQQPDLEKLQNELDELRARRARLEPKTQTQVNGQPIVDPALLLPIDEKIKELEDLLGTKPSELEEIELKPEDIVETTVDRAAQYMEGVEVVLYEPSAEEVRSLEETKILTYIVSTINASQKISFEALQQELFSPKRVGRSPGGGRRLLIYQAKELKKMLQSALRKIREEALVPSLKEGWGEQDKILWDSLTQAAQRLSGSDMEDFTRRVRLEIDRAEREFYRNSPPSENEGNRVHYIRL